MIFNGTLVLKNTRDGNTYGIFDRRKGEFIELSQELDKLRESKIHIHMKNRKGETIFNQKGFVSSRRVGKQLYDLVVGEDVTNAYSENLNVLNASENLSQVLFNYCGEEVSISIKELTGSSEVIK